LLLSNNHRNFLYLHCWAHFYCY